MVKSKWVEELEKKISKILREHNPTSLGISDIITNQQEYQTWITVEGYFNIGKETFRYSISGTLTDTLGGDKL